MLVYHYLQIAAIVALLSAVIYRENSWSNSNQALKEMIGGYEKDIESLKLHLLLNSVDECADFTDFSTSKFQERLMKIISSGSRAMNLKVVDLTMLLKPYIFNWRGVLTIVLCTIAMLVEIFKSHSETVFPSTKLRKKLDSDNDNDTGSSSGGSEDKVKDKDSKGNNKNKDENKKDKNKEENKKEKEDDIKSPKWSVPNKHFETYIAKRKILSNLWMYFLLLLLAVVSWFNVIPINKAVPFIMKFLFLWMVASYLSLFIFNFTRLVKYLPRGFDETKKCLLKWSWWMWLLPRILTSEGFIYADKVKEDNGILTAFFAFTGNFIKDVLYYYPYYYFYYYDHIFYGQNTEIQFTELTRRRNIFLINMILQLSISMCMYNFKVIAAIGSPKGLKNRIKYFLDLEKEIPLTVFIVIYLGNTALCVLRILWYTFTGSSTYFATLILYLFLLPHIAMLFSNTTINFILLEKANVRSTVLENFLRLLIENHIIKNRDVYEAMGDITNQQEVCDEMALLYVDLFEGLLDATGTYAHIIYVLYGHSYFLILIYLCT